MRLRAVIGANYGDEGKGLVTDYLASCDIGKGKKVIVVCNNGGAQRGHTVVRNDGRRHVFHHFGSGTLAGASSYLSPHFIVAPMAFMMELKQLRETTPVYVDYHCRVTTPYELIMNLILEESRGNGRHGSCGMGIWETVKGYRDNDEYLTYGQISNEYQTTSIESELGYRRETFFKNLEKYIMDGEAKEEVANRWVNVLNDFPMQNYINAFKSMKLICKTVNGYLFLKNYDSVIVENGQGLLLNSDKNNVHTTPSYTGMTNIAQIEAVCGVECEPVYVTRTYLTRHGAGDFDEVPMAELGITQADKTNQPNPHQGTLRYGILQPDVLKRIENDAGKRTKSLFITHANEVQIPSFLAKADGFEKIFVSSSERSCEQVEVLGRIRNGNEKC